MTLFLRSPREGDWFDPMQRFAVDPPIRSKFQWWLTRSFNRPCASRVSFGRVLCIFEVTGCSRDERRLSALPFVFGSWALLVLNNSLLLFFSGVPGQNFLLLLSPLAPARVGDWADVYAAGLLLLTRLLVRRKTLHSFPAPLRCLMDCDKSCSSVLVQSKS